MKLCRLTRLRSYEVKVVSDDGQGGGGRYLNHYHYHYRHRHLLILISVILTQFHVIDLIVSSCPKRNLAVDASRFCGFV